MGGSAIERRAGAWAAAGIAVAGMLGVSAATSASACTTSNGNSEACSGDRVADKP